MEANGTTETEFHLSFAERTPLGKVSTAIPQKLPLHPQSQPHKMLVHFNPGLPIFFRPRPLLAIPSADRDRPAPVPARFGGPVGPCSGLPRFSLRAVLNLLDSTYLCQEKNWGREKILAGD